MTLLLAVLAAAAAAQTPVQDCPSDAAGVQTALATALAAANNRDTPGYQTARDQLFTRMDCLTEVLPVATSADIHVDLLG